MTRRVIPSRAGIPEQWQSMVADAVNALLRHATGKIATATADYTVPDDVDTVINNKSGSALTLTLPDAASFPRRVIRIKTLQAQNTISASSNVKPIGSDTAGTAILSNTAGLWCDLKSDGSHWITTGA